MSAAIRPAKQGDTPALVEMGERFFAASGYEDVAEFDAGSFAAMLDHAMSSSGVVLMVAEKDGQLIGMAGALVYPFYFNSTHQTAQEMFWWVDKQHRGVGSKLFEALRAEVKARGAQSLSMIALESLAPERVGAFYQRHGLRPSERSFIGRL